MSVAARPARRRGRERGVGLVEVMIALAILVFGALVTARMQAAAFSGVSVSAFHFAIDRLSTEMLETLRTHPYDAERRLFDHALEPTAESAAETASGDGAESETATEGEAGGETAPLSNAVELTVDWRARVADAIPTAATAIDCLGGPLDPPAFLFCRVEISWMEEIDGTFRRQFFQTGTPL